MKKAARIQLVHWNKSEAALRVTALRDAGYTVIVETFDASSLKRMKSARLDAVVINLCRLPSQGRAFGLGRAFVDYKIAAIDATWSGLCFARRKVK